MKELIIENWPLIISAVVSFGGLCSALSALIVNLLNKNKLKLLEEHIRSAKERETYTVCPHCKEHIPLSDIVFHLPGGEIDNNLNGVPDSVE